MAGSSECRTVRLPGGDWDSLCNGTKLYYSGPNPEPAVAPETEAPRLPQYVPESSERCRYVWSGYDTYECVAKPAKPETSSVETKSLWSDVGDWLASLW